MPQRGILNGSTHRHRPLLAILTTTAALKRKYQSSNMAKEVEIKWLSDVEDHDYSAALSYLCLLCDEPTAARYVEHLRKAPVTKFMAKDLFRASGLSLLGVSNSHVQHDREKVLAGRSLSPLLLVRSTNNQKVIIADGYHRMCAVYSFDEDALIPCKII